MDARNFCFVIQTSVLGSLVMDLTKLKAVTIVQDFAIVLTGTSDNRIFFVWNCLDFGYLLHNLLLVLLWKTLTLQSGFLESWKTWRTWNSPGIKRHLENLKISCIVFFSYCSKDYFYVAIFRKVILTFSLRIFLYSSTSTKAHDSSTKTNNDTSTR